jgi:proteasome lid subunit RPN8/RPN11
MLTITDTAEQVIREHAREAYPNECCGFMYGEEHIERIITHSVPVINSKEGDQRRRFEISAQDYMKAEQYALDKNLTLLGVYHSHPEHPAIPSEHDLKQALPFFSYVIASVKSRVIADIRSWRLDESGKFEEEPIAKQQREAVGKKPIANSKKK